MNSLANVSEVVGLVLLVVLGTVGPAFAADSIPPATAPGAGDIMAANVKTQGNRVWIEGVPRLAGWGNGQECTFLGALAASLQTTGQDISYDWLAGVSGMGFRIQMYQPEWSASSPDAGCGFDAIAAALAATGYSYTSYDTFNPTPAKIAVARAAIVRSINRGVPVMAINLVHDMDWGVVAGYEDNGARLLCRVYEDTTDEFSIGGQQPIIAIVLDKQQSEPDRKTNIVRSLQIAHRLASTKSFGQYSSGLAAWDLWIAALLDDAKWAALPADKQRSFIHPNGWCYMNLLDDRRALVRYLRSVTPELDEPACGWVDTAADLYEQTTAVLASNRQFAPMVSELGDQPWTSDLRHAEADGLRQAMVLEKEAMTSIEKALAAVAVRHEDDRVYIAGLENVEWGNITPRQNSVIAALTAALNVNGDVVTFEQLMGMSGAAFRVQFDWCPSAPHAQCGTNNLDPALAARGWTVHFIDILKDGKEDAQAIAQARTELVKSIDRGVPALASSEECSLIVGYEEGGDRFLLRAYSPQSPGYVQMTRWPWSVGILSEGSAVPDDKDTALRAMELAVQMAKTPKVGEYASGFAAYETWIADLQADRFVPPGKPSRPMAELNGQEMFDATLANGYTYGSLSSARRYAGPYLRQIAPLLPSKVAEHVSRAAELYEQIDNLMITPRGGIPHAWSLMPGDLKGGWTAEQRKTQAAILKDMLALEKPAIAELEQALAAAKSQ